MGLNQLSCYSSIIMEDDSNSSTTSGLHVMQYCAICMKLEGENSKLLKCKGCKKILYCVSVSTLNLFLISPMLTLPVPFLPTCRVAGSQRALQSSRQSSNSSNSQHRIILEGFDLLDQVSLECNVTNRNVGWNPCIRQIWTLKQSHFDHAQLYAMGQGIC